MKSVIVLLFCLLAVSNTMNVERAESERKKVKSQTKINDWSIDNENTYTVYLYVNGKSDYATCKFKTSYVHPAEKVKGDNTLGWHFDNCEGMPSTSKTLFEQLLVKVTQDKSYYLDYVNTRTFNSLGDSQLWGKKGRQITTSVFNPVDSKTYSFAVMFEYGYTGDYITTKDLVTMTTSVNTLRANRQREISSQQISAETESDNYQKIESQINLRINQGQIKSQDYDNKIKAANDVIVAKTNDKLIQEASLTSLDKEIADLNAKLENARAKLQDASQRRSQNIDIIAAKDKEIAYNTSLKTKTTDQFKADLNNYTTKATTAKNNFNSQIASIITNCDKFTSCTTKADLAKTTFNTTPYSAEQVKAKMTDLSNSINNSA